MSVQTLTTNPLLEILGRLKSNIFTGRLVIQDKNSQQWYIYFCLGRVVYTTGGNHNVRRWIRNLSRYCFAVDTSQPIVFNRLTNTEALSESEILQSWEYFLLVNWVNSHEISRKRVGDFIQATILEILFDIYQAGDFTYEEIPEKELSPQLVLFNAEKICVAAYQRWSTWQADGLSQIFPNLSPVIVKPDLIRQVLSASAYQSLENSLDGKRSLREISAQTLRHEATVSLSLLPYIGKGYMNLVETADDFSPTAKFFRDFHRAGSPGLKQGPLVACVDDSLFICKQMEEIFVSEGFQFVGISDSLRAVPTILARKPALIFLDLVMPDTNGYEICGYIRKVSTFRDTPIVILSGNIVEKVRAKMVGASDFLAKPVDRYQVLQIAYKYTQVNSLN